MAQLVEQRIRKRKAVRRFRLKASEKLNKC